MALKFCYKQRPQGGYHLAPVCYFGQAEPSWLLEKAVSLGCQFEWEVPKQPRVCDSSPLPSCPSGCCCLLLPDRQMPGSAKVLWFGGGVTQRKQSLLGIPSNTSCATQELFTALPAQRPLHPEVVVPASRDQALPSSGVFPPPILLGSLSPKHTLKCSLGMKPAQAPGI